MHIQGFAVVAFALTGIAGHIHVGQKNAFLLLPRHRPGRLRSGRLSR